MKIFDDKSFQVLEKSLDLRFKRHALLAGNIANTETPGYQARELDFSGELERAMKDGSSSELAKTNEAHMDIGESDKQAHVLIDNSGAVGADGNNVDLDITTGKMSSNAADYNNSISLMTMKLRLLRNAASGRGI